MKRIISIFLVGVTCVLAVNAWAFEANSDSGVRINRTSSSNPVIIGYYDGTESDSPAVKGWALNGTSNTTIGVYGRSYSTSGKGVYGYASSDTGTTYGVYGETKSTDGYAGYFAGRVGIEGDIKNPNTWWGIFGYPVYVDDDLSVTGDLYVDGNITTRNLAINPEGGAIVMAIAKTEHPPIGAYTYEASKVIDGIKGQWDTGEWASNGEHGDTWIQLSWTVPQTITKCVFIDRSNKYDNILDAWLQIDQTGDGVAEHNIHLGAFPIGGAEKVVNLTSAQGSNVHAMKLYITESVPTSFNVGLSEWECY